MGNINRSIQKNDKKANFLCKNGLEILKMSFYDLLEFDLLGGNSHVGRMSRDDRHDNPLEILGLDTRREFAAEFLLFVENILKRT